ncbi:hypothetical protein A2U01_0096467, partial [Trifolium medium]|nr:hypothetical protein [Trifolium medium]
MKFTTDLSRKTPSPVIFKFIHGVFHWIYDLHH